MVYQAMRDTINVPEHDRFQVIADHPVEGLVAAERSASYSRDRSHRRNCVRVSRDHVVLITQLAAIFVEQKKALYARIAELLAKEPGIRSEDVLINLVECAKEGSS